jgi:tRNA modification GTPase
MTELGSQLEGRGLAWRPFRVVLAGRPNAGKSSLFNRLAGGPLALVSPEPGTTRDYLSARVVLGECEVELIDTAGREEASGREDAAIAGQAQAARREQLVQADLVLLCLDATAPVHAEEQELLERRDGVAVIPLWTKWDLLPEGAAVPADGVPTSAVRGEGLDALHHLLASRARTARATSLAPSLTRCRHHIEACLASLDRAIAQARPGGYPELLALELRLALDQRGEMVGAVYTEDLLDRVFSQFCIGK